MAETPTVPQVAVEMRGSIALCTITNPPYGYMDKNTVEELDSLTSAFENDVNVRAVVFTGGLPGVFIRHYSVGELETTSRRLKERNYTVDTEQRIPERQIDRVFRRLEMMPKPVIAAINGLAMGGGFEMTLACDIRLIEDGPYEVGLPEIRVGILPGAGGTQRLTRLVGTARALEMILRGRTVAPQEAAALGLVHELCVAGTVVERALAIAGEIATKSPLAVAHIKRLVRGALAMPLEEGLALERTLFLDLMNSEEALRLMSAMNRQESDIRTVS